MIFTEKRRVAPTEGITLSGFCFWQKRTVNGWSSGESQSFFEMTMSAEGATHTLCESLRQKDRVPPLFHNFLRESLTA